MQMWGDESRCVTEWRIARTHAAFGKRRCGGGERCVGEIPVPVCQPPLLCLLLICAMERFISNQPANKLDRAQLEGKTVAALAGIAKPEAFLIAYAP